MQGCHSLDTVIIVDKVFTLLAGLLSVGRVVTLLAVLLSVGRVVTLSAGLLLLARFSYCLQAPAWGGQMQTFSQFFSSDFKTQLLILASVSLHFMFFICPLLKDGGRSC